MRETLFDFLCEQSGYTPQPDYLMRKDGTVAADQVDGKWVTNPTPEEMIRYNAFCGRGMPSLLAEKDLTNLGSQTNQVGPRVPRHQSSQNSRSRVGTVVFTGLR